MKYRRLGRTELDVSLICLGSMNWGSSNTQAEGHQQMDYALDQGVNFIDTAEMYAVPPTEKTYGRSEEVIGTWMRARGNRDKVIIATKVAGPDERLHYIRVGNPRLDKKNIDQAIDASLQRLQTDYVDLYQLHWPDRDTNTFGQLGYQHPEDDDSVPLEETLSALADLVKGGKVRHLGISNETPWGTMRFLHLAETMGLPRMVTNQNPYSLLNRTFEQGCAEIAMREQVGLFAYAPMAAGGAFGQISRRRASGRRAHDEVSGQHPISRSAQRGAGDPGLCRACQKARARSRSDGARLREPAALPDLEHHRRLVHGAVGDRSHQRRS